MIRHRVTITRQVLDRYERSRSKLWIGAVLVFIISCLLLVLVLTGKIRRAPAPAPEPALVATSTPVVLVPRRLDGVLVPAGQEMNAPRAVMVENYLEARPLSGVAKANVAIEAPVEGGITRFLLLFDATTTAAEIGPVRSARPYYLDWVRAWQAAYFHVGGSPEALDQIKQLGDHLANVDEMGRGGKYFWRSEDRVAPHNAFTSSDLMTQAAGAFNFVSSTAPVAWHFQDAVTSTERGTVLTVKVAYGGNYSVTWKYDRERGVYVRYQGKNPQLDKDGTPVEAENVAVIKTDASVLDNVGRLKLRTTGSGDALIYRDGRKFTLHWSRGIGETMKFAGTDGAEFIFDRGRTWIEVTTNDLMFAGLEATTVTGTKK